MPQNNGARPFVESSSTRGPLDKVPSIILAPSTEVPIPVYHLNVYEHVAKDFG